MRKLLSLFLLVLGVIAAYKLAVWYGAYRTLTRIQDRFQGVGVLAWEGTASTLTGEVRLLRPRVQFFDLTAPLRADSISFSRPTPWGLLATLYGSPAYPPDQWSLRLDNFRLSVPQQLFKPWASADLPGLGVFNPWRLYQCGPHRFLNGAELRGMGVPRISGDAVLSYRRDPANGLIRLALDMNAGVAGSLDLRIESRPPAAWQWGKGPGVLPGPRTFHLVLRDGGFMRRVSAFCSEATGLTPGQWALQAARAWQAALLAKGWVPSSLVVALYRQWLQQGGELRLDAQPSGAFHWAQIDGGDLGQAIKQAGLHVSYNGDEVPGLDMSRLPQPAPNAKEPARKTAGGASDGQEPVNQAPGFKPLALKEASRWLGRTVKVLYDGGKTMQGRLDAADARSLTVTRILPEGQVSYSIDRADVHQLEVWRSADEAPPLAAPQATSNPLTSPNGVSAPAESGGATSAPGASASTGVVPQSPTSAVEGGAGNGN